jgi:hypothetical protein
MKNFTVVQEHFRKLRCAHCQQSFTPDGVKLLREEKDYWVVRVHCTSCQQPAGVAIVGVEYESSDSPAPERHEREAVSAGSAPNRIRGIFSCWTPTTSSTTWAATGCASCPTPAATKTLFPRAPGTTPGACFRFVARQSRVRCR